jgi:hypothetical protein
VAAVAIYALAKRTLEMEMPRRRLLRSAVIAAAFVGLALPAPAADLTGAWVTDLDACGKVFNGAGGKATFRRDSDMFGSGFIIDGKRVRGRTVSCTINKTQEKDGITHMLASCATEIMLQNVQFSAKVEGEDKITRIFPGIDGMSLTYYRCPAKPGTGKQ